MSKAMKEVECPRCDGKGHLAGLGICFRCGGRKVFLVRASAAVRATRDEVIAQFPFEHPARRLAREVGHGITVETMRIWIAEIAARGFFEFEGERFGQ